MGFVVNTQLPGDGALLAAGTRDVLTALAHHYARLIRAGVPDGALPPLYQSGVTFREEERPADGHESWDCPWVVYQRGYGDCDDLVLWRLSELLAAGRQASPVMVWRGDKFHVLLRHATGRLEDPSLTLMRGTSSWPSR